ncbi:MAG: hypothetical protein F6K24_02075 [Okeania sp. SIO2D1]|nr:hypothetical protein [Okeania sp. SIO2D1]
MILNYFNPFFIKSPVNEKYAEEQTKQKINTEQEKQTQDDDIDTTYDRVSQIINDAYTPEKTMEVDVDVAGIIPDPWMDEVTPVNHAEKLQVPRQEEHSYTVDESIYSNNQIRNYTTKPENEAPAVLDDRPSQIINQGTDRVLEMLETNYYETQHSILERNDEGGVSIWTKDNNGGATLEFHSDASGNIKSSLSEDKSQQFVQLYQEKLDLNPSDAPDIQFQKAEDQAINNSLDLFLTEEQTNRYETDNYTIERNEEGGIDIKDKLSGRGIIFQSDDTGNIENRMLMQESENFTNFSVEVQEYAENKINAAVDKFMEAQNADSYETASFDFNKGVTGWEITNKDGGLALSHEQTKQLLEFSNKVNQAFANNELATSTVGKIKEETEEQER